MNNESTNSTRLKGCRSSMPSPRPMYRTGILNWSEMPMTTPPFAVPSNLVTAMLVTSVAAVITFDTGLPQDIINYLLATYGNVTPIFADSVSTTYAQKLVDNLQGVYTLKPNLLEAQILSGMEIKTFADLEKAAQTIIAKGAKRVFISLGRDGVYYADAEGVTRHRRCKPMEQIANATGAGDSFLGAMLYSHVNDFDLEQTLETAMTVSMLTIQSDNTINPQMSESFMRDNLALATEDTSVNSQDITF